MASEHPDAGLIAQVLADLLEWLAEDVPDPTSQVTGGGAIRIAEQRLSQFHGGRRALLVPSASYGMRATLLAAGARAGTKVLIPGVDWGATLAAVRSIGAEPVPVPTDPATETLDPDAVRTLADGHTAAVVACHLHGVPADVPTIRTLIHPRIPIIEDCCQAMGSTLDGAPVGTLGDAAIFSFGPGKSIDAGEAAAVITGTPALHDRLLALTAHPVRQVLDGLGSAALGEFSMRVAPISAIRLAVGLGKWDPARARTIHARIRDAVRGGSCLTVLGDDDRRANAAVLLPVRTTGIPVSSDLIQVPSAAFEIAAFLAGVSESSGVTLLAQRGRPTDWNG